MGEFWSKEIQSSEILYSSRIARFNDSNKEEWFDLLQICDGMKVLEVGCGPGHFTNMIKRYYPNCEVFGVDLDSGHIDFAKKKSAELNLDVKYTVADVNNLPFEEGAFDIVFSHTLVEHLPFENFVREQTRVLKRNGILIFMHVDSKRKHVNNFTYNEKEINNIYNMLEYKESDIRVGQYLMPPEKYLELLSAFGYRNPVVKFKEIVFYFPDVCCSKEEAMCQITNQELSEVYNAKFSLDISINGEKYYESLMSLIQEKYNERKRLFLENKNVFDYESTAINVFVAIKQ